MKTARAKKKTNHHSGKVPFGMRAVKHLNNGHRAPICAVFSQVYAADPASITLVDALNEEVRKMLDDSCYSEDPSALDDPLPTETQIDIITKVVGARNGTAVSGVGADLRRPPKPRGGATNHHLKMELMMAREEAAKREGERTREHAEVTARLKSLEERFGASSHPVNESDGASCDHRHA